MLTKLLLLALAGGLGTLARFGLSLAVSERFGSRLPWGTLAVNTLGCLLFGCIWALGENGRWITPEQRALVLTGFMGAFTTFSTYGFETMRLLELSAPGGAVAYVVSQNALGLAGVWLGMRLGALVA
ncbi:MAG TPA: fluoride efflux transporter CrcB [Polyangiaceae bacterium]|jgi:CrcB protein